MNDFKRDVDTRYVQGNPDPRLVALAEQVVDQLDRARHQPGGAPPGLLRELCDAAGVPSDYVVDEINRRFRAHHRRYR
jgi:hypothetical protein